MLIRFVSWPDHSRFLVYKLALGRVIRLVLGISLVGASYLSSCC